MQSETSPKLDEEIKRIQEVVKDFIHFIPESEEDDMNEFEEIEEYDDVEEFDENIQSLDFCVNELIQCLELLKTGNKKDKHNANRDLERCVKHCRNEKKNLKEKIDNLQSMSECYDSFLEVCNKYRE